MSREGSNWISGRDQRGKRRVGCGYVRIGYNFCRVGVEPEAEPEAPGGWGEGDGAAASDEGGAAE